MDREAQDSFQLLENMEQELGIKTYPMNSPIGSGKFRRWKSILYARWKEIEDYVTITIHD